MHMSCVVTQMMDSEKDILKLHPSGKERPTLHSSNLLCNGTMRTTKEVEKGMSICTLQTDHSLHIS